MADELEKLVQFHDPSTIAAVFVEPIAGSTGVLVPPKGYLKRLREICDKYKLLLVFDEVITGFGRTGSPFAAQEFGVTPDIITGAKGLTNGCIPMGCVIVSKTIYDQFMQGPDGIEFFHGYTYSGHPVACAAGLATLGIYERDGLLTRAKSISRYWEDAAHSLKGSPHRSSTSATTVSWPRWNSSRSGKPGARAFEIFVKCFEKGARAPDRRHHCAVAAAHRRARADRPDLRHAGGSAEACSREMSGASPHAAHSRLQLPVVAAAPEQHRLPPQWRSRRSRSAASFLTQSGTAIAATTRFPCETSTRPRARSTATFLVAGPRGGSVVGVEVRGASPEQCVMSRALRRLRTCRRAKTKQARRVQARRARSSTD